MNSNKLDDEYTDEELVAATKNGNKEAEEILIEKYKPLVKRKAQNFYILGADHEDVIQEGMIGLFKAIRDYDETKNAGLKTFADLCIRRQIIKAVEKAGRSRNKVLNESYSIDMKDTDGRVRNLEFLIAPKGMEPEEKALFNELLEIVINNENGVLSEFERTICIESAKGNTYSEIAADLGKSTKTVDNALQRSKAKINKIIK